MYLKQPRELRNGFKDLKRLKAIRKLPCLACKEGEQSYPTEPHHKIGCGLGLKASDRLTIALCSFHHALPGSPKAVHLMILIEWEEEFGTFDELLERTNELLSKL